MKSIIIAFSLSLQSITGLSQQEHHQQHKDTAHHNTGTTSPVADTIHPPEHSAPKMPMSNAFSRNLPMSRNGSGTSWLPDNSPVYAYMFHSKKWMYMVHGNVFLRYNNQDLFNKGVRGGKKFDAPNMVMFMGQKAVGTKGLFHFSTMFSADPVTIGGNGYPLLFQTGETYKGQALIDRQHPHDLISELSVSYAHAFSTQSDLFLYLAYPGEPALGPSAFVHRSSGFFNPDAPLSHHWVDATHITFGVATLGYRYRNWKIEASSFTGREPNENRYNFDKPRFDSWSGRLSFNPSPKWALQASHGFIKQPEPLHLNEDVNRTTASATYSSKGKDHTHTNFTVLWGLNKTKGHIGENAVLAEGSYTIKRTALYSRYEWIQKSAEELDLNEADFSHNALLPVHALTAGASYDLLQKNPTRLAIGAQASFYLPDNKLATLYGSIPVAAQVYLRVYPGTINTKKH